MSQESKVQFFVVGAQKSGTTSLHHWLNQHPSISLPHQKETHFFSNAQLYEQGFDWYKDQFTKHDSNSIKGELCPEYLFFPRACERIYNYNPQAKIIIIMREPIERALSQYKMALRSDLTKNTFFNEINKELCEFNIEDFNKATHFSFIHRSLYSQQVQRFQKAFGKDNVLCLRFEDITSPELIGDQCMQRIAQFIGINDHFIFNRNEKSNQASKPRSSFLRDLLYKENGLKKILRLFMTKKVRSQLAHTLDQLNQKPSSYNEVEVQIPETIKNKVYEDLNLVEHLTHLDLSQWKEQLERVQLKAS